PVKPDSRAEVLYTRDTELLVSTVAAVAERETSLAPLIVYVSAGAISNPSIVMELPELMDRDDPSLTVNI
ncbi:MAG: hypothetical protein VYA01_01075, partial [Bacteroidota bacterium]|nr:hypothetical protein [Bacteroidota bacterium]